MSITVQLPKFEGPLALLLYLIRKEEMDIMDIKIHEITGQYLKFLKLMKELDLEVAGEFVAMASTLIHIKSRMLLPQYDENGEIVANEDPRKELVQKLLEYQKYQEAAKLLYERPLVGRDVWLRGVRETLVPQEEEIEIEENALFGLISIYRKLLRTVKNKIHTVTAKTQSIASRILEIRERLIIGHRVAMMELITDMQGRSTQVLITFLSLLELGKLGFVNLYQSEAYAEIWIEANRIIDSDVITRVEEYDNLNPEQVALNMAAKAESESELEIEAGIETESGADEFVLKDAEDVVEASVPVQNIEDLHAGLLDEVLTPEMATDEEIAKAISEADNEAYSESDQFENNGESHA
ncbi:MAG: segregation/condensation protein A [Bdellovibrionaceae bacterium]|nr:segregation/condensation protein A [Pseudobdellovibrionaceae bacterium]